VIFEEKLIFNRQYRESNWEFSQGFLKKDCLIWVDGEGEKFLDLNDVVGVTSDPSNLNKFTVNAYHLTRVNKFSQKTQRRLQEYHFICPNPETRSRWVRAIHNHLSGLEPENQTIAQPRYLYIFVNPRSGKKKSLEIFHRVLPLLERSHLRFTIKITNAAGQIKEILQTLDISDLDGIVSIGGDGTIYEVINGLMARKDWEKAISLPIGIIPGGTGNGLCKTVLELSGEPYDPLSAAFLIAKGQYRALDVIESQQKPKSLYGVLSVAWGFVSDVDIGSDVLRFLGSLKNDIYAIIRIFFLRTYGGKLSFIPYSTDDWQVIEDNFIVLWAMNVVWAAYNIKAAPRANLTDGAIDLLLIRAGISKWQLLNAFLSISNGKHLSLPYVEYYKVRCFKLEPLNTKGILALDGEQITCSTIEIQILQGLARIFCA
jgi:sphingosine kinase